MTELRAVLLASARLPRLSRFVPLLPWEGGTLFEHQLNVLENGPASEVVAVLGYRAEDLLTLSVLRAKVRKVIDPRFSKGYGSGLRVGLRALSASDGPILILPVEYPVDELFVADLVERGVASIGAGASAVTIESEPGALSPVVLAARTAQRLSNRQAFAENLQDTLRRLDGVRQVRVAAGEGGPAIRTPRDVREAVGFRAGLLSSDIHTRQSII